MVTHNTKIGLMESNKFTGNMSEAHYPMPNLNPKVKRSQIRKIHIILCPYNKTDWNNIGTDIRASTTLNSYIIHASRVKICQ